MTVFVYSARRQDAEDWARQQGLRPRDCLLFGNRSKWLGILNFRPGDRIVVLGDIDRKCEAAITRGRTRAAHNAPDVERLPGPTTPPPKLGRPYSTTTAG